MLIFFKNFFKNLNLYLNDALDTSLEFFLWFKLLLLDTADYLLGIDIILYTPTEDNEKHDKLYYRAHNTYWREKFINLFHSYDLLHLDRIEIYFRIYSVCTNIFSTRKSHRFSYPRIFYRYKNYNYKPYQNTYKHFTFMDFIKQSKKHFLFGFVSFISFFRRWALSILLSLLSIYFISALRLLPVNVTLFQWFALLMFLYWLISGFVFFIKKYQFTRYTSVIQRFWRRSYILFWLIESCLLVVFFYLTINAGQETPFMLDQIHIFKTHLFSWRFFLPKLFLLSLLIILGYFLLLSVKWNIFSKNISLVLIITLILTYLLWTEFYQIYHISNFYANFFWSYDADDKMWSLETDARRTRIVNHYVMILFFLKFWHIVFIYGFWIFFVLRINELSRIRYPLYSANFQNFIILYIMAWLFMYPWLKFVFHRFLEVPYFWFYVNNRELGLRVFFTDIKLFLYGLSDIFFFKTPISYNYTSFYYWVSDTSSTSYSFYRKSWIKNNIIKELI